MQPSILEVVVYLFLSLKWLQSSILWSVLCRFHLLYHCSHLLSLIAIRCHSLSLIFTLCHSMYHLLSLVVIRCHSLYHPLSLDVPLFCFFTKDQKRTPILRNISHWLILPLASIFFRTENSGRVWRRRKWNSTKKHGRKL